MSHRNRVTPEGEILAIAQRGLFFGNRGCLHDRQGVIGRALWRHRHWICCLTAFKGRRRALLQPHRYTELFFLDEAVALAAGHRPCAECRRAAYNAYRDALPGPRLGAQALDDWLHETRLTADGRQAVSVADLADLPTGSFIRAGAAPMLVLPGALIPWRPVGYGAAERRPARGRVTVLTPAPSLAALRAGYGVEIHPDALAAL